jgi:hypothetical protein
MSYLVDENGRKYKLGNSKIVFPHWGRSQSQAITTEDDFTITTEDDQILIIE